LGLLLPPSFVLGLLLPPYFRDYYYPPILGIIPPPRSRHAGLGGEKTTWHSLFKKKFLQVLLTFEKGRQLFCLHFLHTSRSWLLFSLPALITESYNLLVVAWVPGNSKSRAFKVIFNPYS
jgi:hypothetical protein